MGDVLLAQRFMCEHFENIYRRLKIITRQIWFLEIIAVIALVIWLGLLKFSTIFPGEWTQLPLSLSLLALFFGVLGTCVSEILRPAKKSTKNRIPKQLEGRVHTLARYILSW